MDTLRGHGDHAGMNIRDLIRHYRYLRTAARELGVARTTLYNWGRRGIPYSYQLQIEEQTLGELRADLADAPEQERAA